MADTAAPSRPWSQSLAVYLDRRLIITLLLGFSSGLPLLLTSLLSQDMYLSGSIILILSVMTVVGTFISDLLLAWVDPRIRYE